MLAFTTKYPIKDKSHGCPNFRNTTKLKYVPTLFFYSREVFIWSQSGALYMQIGPTDWHTQFLLVYFAKKKLPIITLRPQCLYTIFVFCVLEGNALTISTWRCQQPIYLKLPQHCNPLLRLENKRMKKTSTDLFRIKNVNFLPL